ncbi:MAG: hypothetical protein IPJ20_23920, partial [Flammeovirgaceae bacterium]|nr:hypothetical protein [Flammeovirgaceae bacterium]
YGFVLANNAVNYERSINFFGRTSKWTSSFDLSHGLDSGGLCADSGDVNNDGRADLVGLDRMACMLLSPQAVGLVPLSRWTTSFDLSHGWTVKGFCADGGRCQQRWQG